MGELTVSAVQEKVAAVKKRREARLGQSHKRELTKTHHPAAVAAEQAEVFFVSNFW